MGSLSSLPPLLFLVIYLRSSTTAVIINKEDIIQGRDSRDESSGKEGERRIGVRNKGIDR